MNTTWGGGTRRGGWHHGSVASRSFEHGEKHLRGERDGCFTRIVRPENHAGQVEQKFRTHVAEGGRV